MNIVFVGAGNLATHLSLAIAKTSQHTIVQVYSRTADAAQTLASKLGVCYTTRLEQIDRNADLYILSLTDSALTSLASDIVKVNPNALFVHTAGSIDMDVLPSKRRGVFYPMQTFSKLKPVDFAHIPCFIEASNRSDEALLQDLASSLSDSVYALSSNDRKYLHVAAVLCCNFTNFCYSMAQDVLRSHDIPFKVMLPLIDETALKVHSLTPDEAQTGPAARHDLDVIDRHLKMLSDAPEIARIYKVMSDAIIANSLQSKKID